MAFLKGKIIISEKILYVFLFFLILSLLKTVEVHFQFIGLLKSTIGGIKQSGRQSWQLKITKKNEGSLADNNIKVTYNIQS